MKKIYFLPWILFVGLLGYLCYLSTCAKYEEFTNVALEKEVNTNASFFQMTKGFTPSTSIDSQQVVALGKTLVLPKSKDIFIYHDTLVARFGNSFMAQNCLIQAFEQKVALSYPSTTLDTLKALINIGEEYKYRASIGDSNAIFYQSLSGVFLSHVANEIQIRGRENRYAHLDLRWRYLATKCQENKYPINVGNTLYEKVVINMATDRWSYLFNRLIYSTSLLFKIIVFGVIIACSISVIIIYRKLNRNQI